MKKRYLFVVTALVLISLASLFSALKHLERKSVQEILGSYTFLNTKNNLFNLGKVKLINPEGEEITLYYDGIWYFEEAADYFVDEEALQKFFYVIKKSILLENVDEPQPETEFFNMKTYDVDDKILDDVYFSKEDLSLIKYADKNNFYKSSYTDEIPFSPDGWLPYPLLSIPEELVSAVNVNGNYALKSALDGIKLYKKDVVYLFEILQGIDYVGLISEDEFEKQYFKEPMTEIKIYLVGGLNYRLRVYNTPDGYYLKIIPERELIAKTEVNNIIRTKKLYYDDWLFLLNDEQGNLLYNLTFNSIED